MTAVLPAPSLTADISDTNQLLDDLLHQLALHSDHSTLKQLKATHSHILSRRHSHAQHAKRAVQQLTRHIALSEQQLAGSQLDEATQRRRTAEAELGEAAAAVGGLREAERTVQGEVEDRAGEARRLEQRLQEVVQRHDDVMAERKKCKKLYSILAAVKIDAANDTQIKGSYHIGSQVRNFSYAMADEPSDGLTSFDATNALWSRLWEAKMGSKSDVPSTPTSQLTSALQHFQFAV